LQLARPSRERRSNLTAADIIIIVMFQGVVTAVRLRERERERRPLKPLKLPTPS